MAEAREKEDQARVQKRQFIPRGLHRRARGKWVWLQAVNTVPSPSVSSLPSVSDLRVEPLVLSKWGQDYEGTLCYNYYTPYNYPSGCVATAMAQLMCYHTWPTGPVDRRLLTVYRMCDGFHIRLPARRRRQRRAL